MVKLKPLVLMMACVSGYSISHAAEVSVRAGSELPKNSVSEQSNDVQTLETIVVVGSSEKAGGDLVKQPLSTSIITEQQIKDSGVNKLDAALGYEAGILAQPFGSDNKSQWFKVRGFDASQTLDGTPLAPNGFFVWEPEIYGLEALEIVKGANSFNYGSSQTGGNVNLVSKRPGLEPKGELNLIAGNLDKREASADYTGLFNEDGSLRYRVVGLYRQGDSQLEGAYMKHYYFAPSIAWDISDQTHFTLLTSYLKKDGVPTAGFMPAYGSLIDTPYGKIDPHTNLGEPEIDRLKVEQYSAGYEFSHEFDSGVIFTQNFKWNRMDNYLFSTFAWSSDNDRLAYRGYSLTDGVSETSSIDNRLIKDFTFGDFKNRVMFGLDYFKNKTDGVNNGFGSAPPMDMFNPVHDSNFAVSALPYHLETEQLGVYISNQMNWNDLIDLNLGIRQDNAKGKATQDGKTAPDYDEDKTTYNAGLMYHAPLGFSPYLSYSTSFRPSTGIDGYNRAYKPYEGEQYEVGVKYAPEWVDGEITLAYFDLTEKNALVADSSNIQVQAGKRTNKGVELQANLNLTDNLSTQFAYTHNDSEQELSTTNTIRTPAIPNHMVSGKVYYKFINENLLNGLRLGAGVRYVGSSNDEQYYSGYNVDSYTLVDAMASYPLNEQLDVQVNASNLTNEKYISACSFYCYYGAERTVDLRVTYKW
ncbi:MULTISPECIES: TonB-dependent siderophore receptor [Acinetobacter]|uniref:TonB-dependent siderophore receptor n=1 Tax=Acinetobacter TaxID=469 RepID=UPI00148F9D8D|nr:MULTISPECIES: TonB-dependent siderophore receptor [Acinetobacter]MDD0802287.1 TonB-dependent siderophore receptor [Acinetobacter sp. Gutcm_16]NKG38957.1 TonB-dependent siderophore receptor [Acinetobacter johnsonii]